MEPMIQEGQEGARLHAALERGRRGDLKDLQGQDGRPLLLPEGRHPGCTREACAFRDTQAAIKKKGAVVLGVSGDSVAAHEKFKAKYKLNFPLLADADKAVAKKYGAWGEKVMYGKKVDRDDPLDLRDRRGGGRAQGLPARAGGRSRRQGPRGARGAL